MDNTHLKDAARREGKRWSRRQVSRISVPSAKAIKPLPKRIDMVAHHHG